MKEKIVAILERYGISLPDSALSDIHTAYKAAVQDILTGDNMSEYDTLTAKHIFEIVELVDKLDSYEFENTFE